jgi:negative regulator of replication initiation
MRTTLNLDEDIAEVIKSYAESRSVPIGKAASDLIRRGLEAPLQTKLVNGFHVVVLPRNSPKVTTEDVKRLLDEE